MEDKSKLMTTRPPATKWIEGKLGEVCEVSRGSSPRPIADKKYFEGGTIPWIKIADATKSGKYLFETKEKVNEYGASFSRLLPAGSLIVAASGTLGYTQFLGVPGCVHDGWLIVKPSAGVDVDFLYYFLKWRQRYFYNMAYGAAIQNVNTEILREMGIRRPPLNLQQIIASILSAYDDLIENNTRRIAILEEIAQRIYEEWFVHFRFPGHEKVKMIESEFGLIPKGWSLESLGDIADLNRVSIKRDDKPEEISYIDISSVSTGKIDKVEQMKFVDAPGRARRVVRHGDIIWSNVRPNRKSYALIIDPAPHLIVSTGFTVISAVSVPFSFLYLSTTTDEFASYLTNRAKGAAYPAVGTEDFSEARLLVPDSTILEVFNNLIEPLLKKKHVLLLKNQNLRATRDLLLPKLISGEIDVSHFPDPGLANV